MTGNHHLTHSVQLEMREMLNGLLRLALPSTSLEGPRQKSRIGEEAISTISAAERLPVLLVSPSSSS